MSEVVRRTERSQHSHRAPKRIAALAVAGATLVGGAACERHTSPSEEIGKARALIGAHRYESGKITSVDDTHTKLGAKAAAYMVDGPRDVVNLKVKLTPNPAAKAEMQKRTHDDPVTWYPLHADVRKVPEGLAPGLNSQPPTRHTYVPLRTNVNTSQPGALAPMSWKFYPLQSDPVGTTVDVRVATEAYTKDGSGSAVDWQVLDLGWLRKDKEGWSQVAEDIPQEQSVSGHTTSEEPMPYFPLDPPALQ